MDNKTRNAMAKIRVDVTLLQVIVVIPIGPNGERGAELIMTREEALKLAAGLKRAADYLP